MWRILKRISIVFSICSILFCVSEIVRIVNVASIDFINNMALFALGLLLAIIIIVINIAYLLWLWVND